jgi:hypothetical protein
MFDSNQIFLFMNNTFKWGLYKSFKSTFLCINQEVRVDTWIKIADNNKILNSVHVNNVVEFVCNYANECDRCFVFKIESREIVWR